MKFSGVLFFFSALTALALAQQPLMGNVYGVYPEGVMLTRGGSNWLVPLQHVTFQAGGVNLSLSQLVPGQSIQCMVPPQYMPQVINVVDPGAWVSKHHPHGGPPGQMKKRRKRF